MDNDILVTPVHYASLDYILYLSAFRHGFSRGQGSPISTCHGAGAPCPLVLGARPVLVLSATSALPPAPDGEKVFGRSGLSGRPRPGRAGAGVGAGQVWALLIAVQLLGPLALPPQSWGGGRPLLPKSHHHDPGLPATLFHLEQAPDRFHCLYCLALPSLSWTLLPSRWIFSSSTLPLGSFEKRVVGLFAFPNETLPERHSTRAVANLSLLLSSVVAPDTTCLGVLDCILPT